MHLGSKKNTGYISPFNVCRLLTNDSSWLKYPQHSKTTLYPFEIFFSVQHWNQSKFGEASFLKY